MNMHPKNMAEYEEAMEEYRKEQERYEKNVKLRTDIGPMAKFSQLPYPPCKPPDFPDPMAEWNEQIRKALGK